MRLRAGMVIIWAAIGRYQAYLFIYRSNWQALFTYREGNSAAHTLSRKALQMDGEQIRMEEGPNVIYSAVMEDMACN